MNKFFRLNITMADPPSPPPPPPPEDDDDSDAKCGSGNSGCDTGT